jgi:predicted type IV restriction endonuclease
MAIPKRTSERMASALKRLVPIIQQQRTRDVSEADTVTLVKDVFAEVLGYDKYTDLTGELAIRGTYCDLAVKIDDKISQLVEIKAIGLTLSERHLRQAVDYAANQGIEWVILTNAVCWQLYHIIFAKPIDKRLVIEIDLTTIDPRKEEQLEPLYSLTREGFSKGLPAAIRDRQDATSRYLLSALLIYNESVLNVIRRELRRVADVNVSDDEILAVLRNEVVKRDTLEGPPADEAARRVKLAHNKMLRAESPREEPLKIDDTPPTTATPGSDTASV